MLSTLIGLLPLVALVNAHPVDLNKRYTRARIVSGRDGKCLTAAPKTGSGSEVYTTQCGGTGAELWTINPGSGSVLVGDANSNLALDAGSNPGNNGALKVWTSYPGLYQQTWYLTDDNRIAITGGDQCLDEGDNGVQTYQCTPGNTNQVWHVVPEDGSVTTSSSAPSSTSSTPTSTSSSAPSSYPSFPSGPLMQIVSGRDGKCLIVNEYRYGVGSEVTTGNCDAPNTVWILNRGSGTVYFGATGYALDAGSTPGNNGGLKLGSSSPGSTGQTWYWTDDDRIAITGGDQCLDEGDNGAQTYQCTPGNTNQVWYVRAKGTGSSSVAPSSTSSAAPSSTPSSSSSVVQIYSPRDGKCLIVNEYKYHAFTPVTSGDCSNGNTYWTINRGSGSVFFGAPGSLLVLDAGSNPSNHGSLALGNSDPGSTGQTWYYTDDNRIAITGGDQCLDEGDNGVQTYQCTTGNTNQVWYTRAKTD